jgi:DNA-directed RNA polymerase subunit RPC12/RpoP
MRSRVVLYTLEMARRNIQLVLHDHIIDCPYCDTKLVFTSPQEILLMARRTCAKCKREFLIENGKAMKDSTKQRPPATVTEMRRR